jgi:hypothetical protein
MVGKKPASAGFLLPAFSLLSLSFGGTAGAGISPDSALAGATSGGGWKHGSGTAASVSCAWECRTHPRRWLVSARRRWRRWCCRIPGRTPGSTTPMSARWPVLRPGLSTRLGRWRTPPRPGSRLRSDAGMFGMSRYVAGAPDLWRRSGCGRTGSRLRESSWLLSQCLLPLVEPAMCGRFPCGEVNHSRQVRSPVAVQEDAKSQQGQSGGQQGRA